MPKFLMAYHGGTTPTSEAEVEKTMAAWTAWFEAMGQAVVDPGNPVTQSYTVSESGVTENGGANPVSGYTVLDAADIQAACDIAKGCPMVMDGSGSVEVAEIHEM